MFVGLSGHYDGIPETVLYKRYFEKEKRTTKHAKNYYALTLIYSSMNIKYPIKTSFQTFIH